MWYFWIVSFRYWSFVFVFYQNCAVCGGRVSEWARCCFFFKCVYDLDIFFVVFTDWKGMCDTCLLLLLGVTSGNISFGMRLLCRSFVGRLISWWFFIFWILFFFLVCFYLEIFLFLHFLFFSIFPVVVVEVFSFFIFLVPTDTLRYPFLLHLNLHGFLPSTLIFGTVSCPIIKWWGISSKSTSVTCTGISTMYRNQFGRKASYERYMELFSSEAEGSYNPRWTNLWRHLFYSDS